MEARQEEKLLVEYENDLRDICAAAQDAKIELTKDWVEQVFRLKPLLGKINDDGLPIFHPSSTGGLFTSSNIKDAFLLEQREQECIKKKEQEQESMMKLYNVIPEFVERRQLSHSGVRCILLMEDCLPVLRCSCRRPLTRISAFAFRTLQMMS